MPAPTRLPAVAVLAACALFAACGGDEPAPQHPTAHHHKKHKKKHKPVDADSVVIADDTSDDDSDDARPHHAKKEVAEADHPDDEDTKKTEAKHEKKSDDDDTKKADDEDTKKSEAKHKKSDADEDTKKKRDADEDTDKADREDDTKKADRDDDEKKADEPAKKRAPTKKPARRPSKRKRVAAHKAAKPAPPSTEPPADEPASEPANDNEIEMDEDPLANGPAQAAADAGGDGDEQAEVAASVPAPASTTAPLAINDRGLVGRRGGLEVHGGLPTLVLTLPGVMPGTTTSSTSEGLAFGATYGIGEKAEIGGDYALSLSPGSIQGPLTLHGAYLAYAHGKLDIAVAAAVAVDFLDAVDPTTMKTTTTSAFALELGGWVRYRATPKVSLFTGLPALPSSTVSLSKLSFALPPLPYQLAVGLSSGSAIALDLPGGVGFQAAPNVYAFAMLNLAHLRISNTQTALLFKDFIPVTVGGFYSRDKLDLGATLGDDLKQGTDYLRFELIARYAIQ